MVGILKAQYCPPTSTNKWINPKLAQSVERLFLNWTVLGLIDNLAALSKL